jgi:hypothetical protein
MLSVQQAKKQLPLYASHREEGRGSAHGITGHVNWRGVKEGAMLIHSKLPRSAVNGPGERVVLWLQGCDLRCRGCWNPSSHAFDRTRDKQLRRYWWNSRIIAVSTRLTA